MATIDFTSVQGDMAKLQALQATIAATTDPTVKAVLNAEAQGLQSSITAELAHAQAQADATANSFNQLQLMSVFNGLGTAVTGSLPTIINLFK